MTERPISAVIERDPLVALLKANMRAGELRRDAINVAHPRDPSFPATPIMRGARCPREPMGRGMSCLFTMTRRPASCMRIGVGLRGRH
jgi:hypothetical protein